MAFKISYTILLSLIVMRYETNLVWLFREYLNNPYSCLFSRDISLHLKRITCLKYDEIGIVINTCEKSVCISKMRTERAIVGTTLHVHVIHRKLFINETAIVLLSEISWNVHNLDVCLRGVHRNNVIVYVYVCVVL